MNYQIGQNIRTLRRKRQVSQEDLAETMGVTVQAVSKWETGKANPDLELLPKVAEYFGVTIDSLFLVNEADNILLEEDAIKLEQNASWWDDVPETELKAMSGLPNYGFFTPTEDTLGLLGDVRGKTVLELACGKGDSLVWMAERGAKELWGLDISSAQIQRTKQLLKEKGKEAKLFVSPMEINPGLPYSHFDLVFSIYGIGWSMDLDKTITRAGEYLKPGGRLIFSWDNPLMQCMKARDGQYILTQSYLKERDIKISDDGFCLHNWKLSTYLNCLAAHGFLIEQVVEESYYDEKEADVFQEGKFYSAGRARLINPVFIVKARKLW